MADAAFRIGGGRGGRKHRGPFLGPGPMPSPCRRGERWDLSEEFDQPPGTTPCPPSGIVFTAGFNTAVFRTTAPMPYGFKNGYLYMTGPGAGSYAWTRLENAGYTVDGPGINRGIEILYRAMVDNGSIDTFHHRAPRMAVLTTGGLTCYHIKKDYAKIGVHADNGGVNEVLSAERQSAFDWSNGKWVWNRIRIVNWRMWFKAWNDTVMEPGAWLFEDYDLSALGGLPASNYIYRIGNWHSECKVGLANFSYRLLNWPRELLIQHDFPMNGQTNNCPMSCYITTTFTYETGKYLDVGFRRLDDNNMFWIVARINGDLRLVRKQSGGENTVQDSFGVFTDGVQYKLDIEINGKVIKAWVDGQLKLNVTDTFQMTQAGGLVWHNYATNDILLKVYS